VKFSRRDVIGAGIIATMGGKIAVDNRRIRSHQQEIQALQATQNSDRLGYVPEGNLRRPTSAIVHFAKARFRSQEQIVLRDPFHEILRQSIIKRAAYWNAQVITFPHGLSGNPAEGAAEKLERFLREPYGLGGLPLKGVLLSPVDSYVYTTAMRQAETSKIPIVTLDTPLDEVNRVFAISHVGSNNEKLGQALSTYAMTQVPPPAEVLAILGPYRELNSDFRMIGMLDAMSGQGYDITTIGNGDWSTFFGRGAIKWFNRLKPVNDLAMVLCANDGMAKGVALYYQSLNPWDAADPERPFIGGIDGSKDGKDFIERGLMDCTVDQRASEMGKVAVDVLVNHVDQDIQPELFINLGIGDIITRAN